MPRFYFDEGSLSRPVPTGRYRQYRPVCVQYVSSFNRPPLTYVVNVQAVKPWRCLNNAVAFIVLFSLYWPTSLVGA